MYSHIGVLTFTYYCCIMYIETNKENEMTTTIRQLRAILFEIDNQDMTVRELRAILFEIDNQDKNINPTDLKAELAQAS